MTFGVEQLHEMFLNIPQQQRIPPDQANQVIDHKCIEMMFKSWDHKSDYHSSKIKIFG